MRQFLACTLFSFSTLVLVPSMQLGAQPAHAQINTETRQVTMVRQREQVLLDALGDSDASALASVLADDFTQHSLSLQMLSTPRADWLRNLAAHPFGKAHIENVSAIDHGSTLVANFDLLVGEGTTAKRYGVVDVWTKPQDAGDWILSQRYIAAPAPNAQAPGDNAPDTAGPRKRI